MNPRVQVLLGFLFLHLLGAVGSAGDTPRPTTVGDLEARIAALDLESLGIQLGIQVAIEGKGVVYNRAPEVPRSTASAIKTAIALDLLHTRGDKLDETPVGVEALLQPGTHPAFRGFTSEDLDRGRNGLVGKTYWELARIMMGRDPANNEVYNAACNLIMIKLGGPEAIQARLGEIHPDLLALNVNRYMQSWNGDGDNSATPRAMVSLYRMTSSGHIPGLSRDQVDRLRDLLLEEGEGGPGSVYEKMGTLFPRPMVRVHAGFEIRESGNLVYAVMGEIPEAAGSRDGADLFMKLMTVVDSVTEVCRGLSGP